MTSRTLKLLTASTAFVAAASVGNAVDISTSLTATQYTSETGAFNVTGAGSISTTGAAAIAISSTTAASNTITIGTGTTVQATDSTDGVIFSDNADNAAVVINVSGTVSALSGTTKAIDLAGMAAGNTVRNDGTISGSVTLGNGTNTFTSNGGTTNGNITGGTGADTVTLTNATVNGDMSGGAGAADVLNINGTQTFTTGGTIGLFETVNFNTDTVIEDAITGVTTSSIAADKTVTVNEGANLGDMTNNGLLNIAADTQVNATTYTGTGTLGIAIASANTANGMGQLVLSTGSLVTGTLVKINMASTAGYIANGTSYTIATGNAAHGSVSLTTEGNGVLRYSAADNGNDELVLTINRVSMSDVVTGGDAKDIGNVLDALGASATGELATVQGVIGSQSTASGVQNVIESLTPSIDGAGVASVNFAVDAGNQVSNRLASVRSNGYGVATGDAMSARHMWAQGFGSTLSQDDKDGARGYDADSAGASIGIDTDTLVDGLTTGAAFTYGKSTVDSNASGGASTDIDSYAATLYGSRVMDNGVFVNGQLGVGFNQYEMERTIAGVGQSKGDTDGLQGTAKIETGRDYAFGGATLTPLASLQYTYLDMDSYTETGAGGASLKVNPDAMSTVDAGIGGEASYAIALSDGGTLKPSVRAKYIYRMGDEGMQTTSQFVGGGTAFSTNGVEADKSSVNLGAGLLLTTVGGTDLSLNYDADIRSSLTGHTGQIKARWAF